MSTKYSDFIQLQDFLPVYDILDENPNTWKSFIPTAQFNDLLRRSLTDMTSTEVSKRKSIWVRGTFGTGKSHASAVVKHLLCDDFSSVSNYIEQIKDPSLKNQLKAIRSNKRYFSVTLKGVEGAYDIPNFVLSIQRALAEAIKKVDPTFVVKSDYTAAINWIVGHRRIFDTEVFPNADALQSIFNTTEQVLESLAASKPSTYLAVKEAVMENVGNPFEHTSISEWLAQVEKEIEARGIADGLIIFWDEFTSVMDTLKSDRINVLQNIAEKSQNNNVFLFLISHRVASQSDDQKSKDITKMSDRFDEIEYKMDSLSTYLIMRHSFTIPNAEANAELEAMRSNLLPKLDKVLDFLTNGNHEQKSHIDSLLPLHPYTAFLCSEMANYIGSSNRSVIRFMHDEDSGFGAFLNNENCYGSDMLLTVDSLWDFFLPSFENDPASSTFTGLYNSFADNVRAQSEDHLRVFKAILVLNALSPKFQKSIELMKPNDNVLSLMYAGDRIQGKIIDILNYLHDHQIVVRDIFDEFKIRGTSYNPNEMNSQRTSQKALFKNAYAVLDYDREAKEDLEGLFKIPEAVHRETTVMFLSCEDTEQLIRSKLNKFTADKPNYTHVACFLSIKEEDRDDKISLLRNLSNDYPDLVVVLPDESFSGNTYNKFIDSLANYKLATIHFNNSEAKEHEKFAHAFVKKWVNQLKNNTFSLFFNGQSINEGIIDQLPTLLNDRISIKIFTNGFESLKFPKSASIPYTFFSDKNCPTVIQQVLQAQTRDKLTVFKGVGTNLKYLFEDGPNTLLTSTCELSEAARNGDSWLVEICRHMDSCMEKARKEYADKFCLSEILASFIKPPYGMFTSMLNCAAIAYAIRKHKGDLFVPAVSQPISDEALASMIADLFKMWKDGKSDHNKNLMLRFGSPEESQLTGLLVDLFELPKTLKVKASEIKSLDNAKWYIQDFCMKVAKQPLWTLTYLQELNDLLKEALKDLISLLTTENPTVDKIKATYRTLKRHHMDLNILLTNVSNYERGFNNFVDSIDGCTIKKEWWNEMLVKIDQLPKEIGFRKESDVRETILKFYITKIQGSNDGNSSSQSGNSGNQGGKGDGQGCNAGGGGGDQHTQIEEAKEKIKTLNMPNTLWRQIALDLLKEFPEVADFFNRL